MFKYTKHYEMLLPVHNISINIFNRYYIISFTIKYPSYDFEIWDLNKMKRLYEKAWFSNRFDNYLESLKKESNND